MVKIQSPRGMRDILPHETPNWQFLEQRIATWLHSYGYNEIRFPLLESTDLFKRSIGEVTDIVEKEMFSFEDRGGDSLTLRPEGTAGSVRAGLQHDLLFNKIQRLWYSGPMFRYERPQEGRYRQFHQVGVEAFGMPGPDIDAELIIMSARLWERLGVTQHVSLQINSLGSTQARAKYRESLVAYLTQHYEQLDADSQRRLERNPLRVLDSKAETMRDIVAGAPNFVDFLDEESAQHFARLRQLLDAAGVPYVVNTRLVRGLDYYGKTVFEWVTDKLGAQSAVCAGGRYDGLVEQLGGRATPAVGMALGMERVLLLLEKCQALPGISTIDCYVIGVGDEAQQTALLVADQLRTAFPHHAIVLDCGSGGMKAKFRRADASMATLALIIGEQEALDGTISVKYLREQREQQIVARGKLIETVRAELASKKTVSFPPDR